MADDEAKYDSGYRFNPFDEELIEDYLKPKVLGKQLPNNTIKNTQVYGPSSNPWLLFHPQDPSWLKAPQLKPTQKFMFVFTKLSKLSDTKSTTWKNTSKKAGCGTWVGKTSRKKIMDGNGDVIGECRYLVYEINDTDSAALGVGIDFRKVGFYTMHEYSLSGINEGLDSADKIVVCKITHDSSKKTTLDLKPGTKIADRVLGNSSVSQIKEENNSILEGTGTENLTVMDSGVGDYIEESRTLTSKGLVARNIGVGDCYVTPQFENNLHELDAFGGDFCFSDLGGEDFCLDDIDILEGTGTENLTVMDSGVGDYLEESGTLTSGGLVVRNIGVGDCYVTPQFENNLHELDAFGGDFCFSDLGGEDFCLDDIDIDRLMAYLDSKQDEGPLENSTFNKPGKRKSEAIEESYQTKKMCI